jgi:hypothetical protein
LLLVLPQVLLLLLLLRCCCWWGCDVYPKMRCTSTPLIVWGARGKGVIEDEGEEVREEVGEETEEGIGEVEGAKITSSMRPPTSFASACNIRRIAGSCDRRGGGPRRGGGGNRGGEEKGPKIISSMRPTLSASARSTQRTEGPCVQTGSCRGQANCVPSSLQDPCFLPGDRLQTLTQHLRVMFAHARHHAHNRQGNKIGRIIPPSNPHFQNNVLHPLLHKPRQCYTQDLVEEIGPIPSFSVSRGNRQGRLDLDPEMHNVSPEN